MRIGELAQRVGLSPKTIRYYEAIGVLPQPSRTASGYRRYDEAAVSRLGFVQRAKRLGLTLRDIREVLAIHEHGALPCARVLAVIDAELARIDHRMAELTRLREDLIGIRRRWSDRTPRLPDAACLCPIIEQEPVLAGKPLDRRTLDLPADWKV